MKNIINEEINKINYLFGYKRGIVISEQEVENTPIGKVGAEELGKAPSSMVNLMMNHLENSYMDVKNWCNNMKQKHGDGVCVIGKSNKMNIADTMRGTYELQLARENYKKVEEGPTILQDDNKKFYKISYMVPKS
jgi:hypothetical protein